jgi:putative hemolysin
MIEEIQNGHDRSCYRESKPSTRIAHRYVQDMRPSRNLTLSDQKADLTRWAMRCATLWIDNKQCARLTYSLGAAAAALNSGRIPGKLLMCIDTVRSIFIPILEQVQFWGMNHPSCPTARWRPRVAMTNQASSFCIHIEKD